MDNDGFSPNSTQYNNSVDVDLAFVIPTGISLGVICCVTIFGNILVLVAVATTPQLRGSATNYFIVNLAVADLCLGVSVLPFSASLEVLRNKWLFGSLFCDIWLATDVLCCTGSIMSLCAISVDRYIGVTKPLRHHRIMSSRKAGLCVLMIWVLSIGASVPPFLGWRPAPDPDPTICMVNTDEVYVIYSAVVSFYAPAAIIIFVYSIIYYTVAKRSHYIAHGIADTTSANGVALRMHVSTVRHKKKDQSSPHSRMKKSSTVSLAPSTQRALGRRRDISTDHGRPSTGGVSGSVTNSKVSKMRLQTKAAKTLGIVVGVFFCCWAPFFLMLPLVAFCTTCGIDGDSLLFKVIFWLGYCNSMCNPIIYASSSREFRNAFHRLLCCEARAKRMKKKYQNAVRLEHSDPHVPVSPGGTLRKPTIRDKSLHDRRFSCTPLMSQANSAETQAELSASSCLTSSKDSTTMFANKTTPIGCHLQVPGAELNRSVEDSTDPDYTPHDTLRMKRSTSANIASFPSSQLDIDKAITPLGKVAHFADNVSTITTQTCKRSSLTSNSTGIVVRVDPPGTYRMFTDSQTEELQSFITRTCSLSSSSIEYEGDSWV